MGYFNPNFFNELNAPIVEADFVELPMLDAEFDAVEDDEEMLVVYDAFGGIQHTVAPHNQEATYE